VIGFNFTTTKTFWQIEVKEARLHPIKVCCQPGDYVLWDSRTIHCNAPATVPRAIPKNGSILPPRRLVAYVCMTPTSRLTPEKREARVKAYQDGSTTSHWPEECIVAPARVNHLRNYVPPPLTDHQKKLVPLE